MVYPSTDIFVISSQSHPGITEVLRALRVKVQQVRESNEPIKENQSEQPVVISLPDHAASARWKVVYNEENSVYRVTGEKSEKFAIRTNYDQFEKMCIRDRTRTEKRRSSSRFPFSLSSLSAYLGVFLLIVSVVAMTYQPPQRQVLASTSGLSRCV